MSIRITCITSRSGQRAWRTRPTRGGMTRPVTIPRTTGSPQTSGGLAGLRLCIVMHSATVEGLARGRACWAAGQIGESTHTPVNGCPQRITAYGDRGASGRGQLLNPGCHSSNASRHCACRSTNGQILRRSWNCRAPATGDGRACGVGRISCAAVVPAVRKHLRESLQHLRASLPAAERLSCSGCSPVRWIVWFRRGSRCP
jgi:hypothetical protein